MKVLVAQSSPTLQFHAPYPARLLCPWNSPGKNTGLGSVQFSRSVVSDFLQPHELQHARPPCPSQIPEFTQTHAHRVSNAIQPSYPLSSPSPPTPSPSSIRVFSNESTLRMRWPKYWSFSFFSSFSSGRSGGLVSPSLSEFSTVYCDRHSRRLWHSQ